MDTALQRGLTSFSLSLYKAVSGGEGNVFISPHSVTSALMLACLGARGNTQKQITDILGFGEKPSDQCHEDFRKINDVLKNLDNDGTLLTIANRIYVRDSMKATEQFTKDVSEYYAGGIEKVDFASPTSHVVINKWVEEQTNAKIKDLLAEPLDVNTTNVIVNAIYFKGLWETQFKPENTVKENFYVTATDAVQVNMMKQKIKIPFHLDRNLGFSAAELSYKNGSVAMMIILPNEKDGLSKVEKELTTDVLNDVFEALQEPMRPSVNVGLPKFKFEASCTLSKVLASIGITDLFDPEKADMTGLLEKVNNEVSEVVHKAFIEVNEEGTEAAAATAMMSRMRALPVPDQMFICDHPFLILLRDCKTGSLLFIGRYAKPE